MPPKEPESAAAAFTRTGQDAVTYARRVAGEALARNERHRADNAALAKSFGRGRLAGGSTDATPDALRAAAKRFRRARGLPAPEFPAAADLVPPRPEPPARATRSGDDEEDFSQTRIMKRDL